MRKNHGLLSDFFSRRVFLTFALCSAGLLLAAASVSLAPTATPYKWSQLGTTTLSERQHASVAFDAATSQLIIFGGDHSVGTLNDTWAFSGTRWNRLAPPQPPPARTSG